MQAGTALRLRWLPLPLSPEGAAAVRQMFDSVDASRIPPDAVLVGAYVDGLYANEAAVRARCPNARVVTITVTGRAGAHVADCETGDLTPQSAVGWARQEQAAGRTPTIYCNTSTWPAVQRECEAQGVPYPSFWIAQYDGVAEVPTGAVAKQYQERTDQNLDYSLASDHWPGVDPTEEPVTAQEIEQIAAKVVEMLRPLMASHEDMKVLLHGTQDGTHPYSLTSIAKAVGVHGP